MPERRRRILEMWNRCASVELEGAPSDSRIFTHHFFFAGAMAVLAILYDEPGKTGPLLDVEAELREHVQKLEELAKETGLEVVS